MTSPRAQMSKVTLRRQLSATDPPPWIPPTPGRNPACWPRSASLAAQQSRAAKPVSGRGRAAARYACGKSEPADSCPVAAATNHNPPSSLSITHWWGSVSAGPWLAPNEQTAALSVSRRHGNKRSQSVQKETPVSHWYGNIIQPERSGSVAPREADILDTADCTVPLMGLP